ncbi:unnamed protein product [Urochloa humidicola]
MVWPAKTQKPVADAGCSSDLPEPRATRWPTTTPNKTKISADVKIKDQEDGTTTNNGWKLEQPKHDTSATKNVKAKDDSAKFKRFTDNMKGDNIDDDQDSNKKKGNEKHTPNSAYRSTQNPQENVSCQHKSIEKGKTKVDNGKLISFADSMKNRNINGQDRKKNGQQKKMV